MTLKASVPAIAVEDCTGVRYAVATLQPCFEQTAFRTEVLLLTVMVPGVTMDHWPRLLLRVQSAPVTGTVSIWMGCEVPSTIAAQPDAAAPIAIVITMAIEFPVKPRVVPPPG